VKHIVSSSVKKKKKLERLFCWRQFFYGRTMCLLAILQKKHPRLELARPGYRAASPWPRASPDLNPIEEYIWLVMKQNLGKYDPPITTISHFTGGCSEGNGRQFDWVTILKLVETMPARIKAVIDAKGGHYKVVMHE
jgi:hypothetical protein